VLVKAVALVLRSHQKRVGQIFVGRGQDNHSVGSNPDGKDPPGNQGESDGA
jgi:hypothetical protein